MFRFVHPHVTVYDARCGHDALIATEISSYPGLSVCFVVLDKWPRTQPQWEALSAVLSLFIHCDRDHRLRTVD